MARWRPQPEEERQTKLVPIRLIETEPTVENRLAEPDRLVVRTIAAAIRRGVYPPPIVVYHLPCGRHVLVDGRNRLAAATMAGQTEIMAEVHRGTLVNATWAAAAANQRPAQARTPAEDRLALELALQAAPTTSDEVIAEHVGCSRAAVREARRRGPLSGG